MMLRCLFNCLFMGIDFKQNQTSIYLRFVFDRGKSHRISFVMLVRLHSIFRQFHQLIVHNPFSGGDWQGRTKCHHRDACKCQLSKGPRNDRKKWKNCGRFTDHRIFSAVMYNIYAEGMVQQQTIY